MIQKSLIYEHIFVLHHIALVGYHLTHTGIPFGATGETLGVAAPVDALGRRGLANGARKNVEPKLRINVRHEPPVSDTLSEWPPSNMKRSRERLEEWLRLFVAIEQWERVEECEGLLFAVIAVPRERHDALIQSGDRWWRVRGDLARARNRYRQAVESDRLSERAQARLRAVAHELGRRRIQPFRPAS